MSHRGFFRCEVCGWDVRRERAEAHAGSPDCLVKRTHKEYEARGWVRAKGRRAAIEAAGLPLEHAPAIVDRDRPPIEAAFAPASAVEAAEMVAQLPLQAADQLALMRRLFEDNELRNALTSARDLGGGLAMLSLAQEALKSEGG